MKRFQLPHSLKTALSVATIGSAGLLASGCGTTAATTTSQTYDLRVWKYGVSVDPFRDTFTTFKKQYPDSNIAFQNTFSSTGYESAALASLASKTGPEIWSYPDGWVGDEEDRVVHLPDNFLGDPKQNGGKSLAEAVKATYPANIAAQIINTNNQIVGVASNVDSLRLYVNNEVLSAAASDYRRYLGDNYDDDQYQLVRKQITSPPSTWDGLLKQIPYIVQKNGGVLSRSAIALGTSDNIPDADAILQLLMYQNGAQILNSDRTRSAFSSQQTTPSGGIVRPGEKALTFFTSFSNPSSSAYTWNPSLPQAADAFAQGKVAMVIDYADFGALVKSKYPTFSFDTAPVPQITGATTPVNLSRFNVDSVTKNASSIVRSEQLLSAISSATVTTDAANSSGLRSPYLSVLRNNTDDFLSQAALTTQTVYKRHHQDFDVAFLQMIRDVSQNGATASGAIDQASSKINALLLPVNRSPAAVFNSVK